MSTYLDYLNQISSPKTFLRKTKYIKYNFGKYLIFKNPSDIKVLEIGPGLGETIHYLNDKGIGTVDVADNDQTVLNYVNDKFKIDNLFHIDDVHRLDNTLDSYDAIIATQVLEHLPKNECVYFLNILLNHLKKDGHIIITVPNMANPFTLCERYADTTHENGFTDNSLRGLAAKCDIPSSSVEIKEFNIPPYSPINVIRIVLQKALHMVILLLSIVNGGSYSTLLTPNITLVIKGNLGSDL